MKQEKKHVYRQRQTTEEVHKIYYTLKKIEEEKKNLERMFLGKSHYSIIIRQQAYMDSV